MNNLIKETKQLHLSTTSDSGIIKNADPNFKSLIEFNVPNFINKTDDIEYIVFSIPYAVIPASFYTINETNNVLSVLENSVTTNYVFLPYGNYNANTFITLFKSILPVRFNITLNSNTSKFTITNTTYNFTLLVADSTIDFIMGFSSNAASSSLSLTLPRVCNFLQLPRISIRCIQLSNGLMTGSSTNDLIVTIPNNAKLNGQIIYNNFSNIQMLFHQENLSSFLLSLTNDDGVPLNFNGISSFFTFQFDIYRSSLPKINNFIKTLENVNLHSTKNDINNMKNEIINV